MPASSTFTATERSRLPGPAWLQAEREAAFDRFAAMDALPTEAEEIWRYSRISNLDLDAFTPALDLGAQGPVPDRVAALLGAIGERAGLAVTREGGLATLEAGENMTGVNFAGGKAFVISSTTGFVYVYDMKTLRPAGRIKVGTNVSPPPKLKKSRSRKRQERGPGRQRSRARRQRRHSKSSRSVKRCRQRPE